MSGQTPHGGDFAGQVALVSGAAQGIGAATAALLAARGARVALADVNEKALDACVQQLEARGLSPLALAADVSNAADCTMTAERTLERLGRLDVLINNAAVGAFDATLDTTTEEQWEHVLDVNLKSIFLLSRACVSALRQSGGGAIVNVSSVHALATAPGVLPYAAAKGGVLALTRALAIDLAPDRIRAVAVLPGAVDTPMLREQAERTGKSYEELGFPNDPTALGRIARPEEVAEIIAFAASPAATIINGSGIIADAGLLAAL
jgi:NAD(P)-dependent dehydrogenase (short-subunit alcohol dehydrogenase family)